MGPPELPGGNVPADFRLGGGTRASMGPPELPGGNILALQTPRNAIIRFNGAAGITRRKHTSTTNQTIHVNIASMGPPELPGGNLLKNGRVGLCYDGLQWGRRNYPAETRRRYSSSRARGCALQWGRRNYPAETLSAPLVVLPGDPASMGPPELPGGNSPSETCHTLRASELQWGRRNYPAETSNEYLSIMGSTCRLQWGRRNYPAETRHRMGLSSRGSVASMGPPELPGGNG